MTPQNPESPGAPDGSGRRSGPDGADEPGYLVVGGGQVGRRLAGRLAVGRERVHHLDPEPTAVADPPGHEASHAPDVTAMAALAATGVGADDVVVLLERESRNLLVAQLLRTEFGVGRIYAVLEDPRTSEAFDVPGVEVVCAAEVLTEAVLTACTAGEVRAEREPFAPGAGAGEAPAPETPWEEPPQGGRAENDDGDGLQGAGAD